MTTENTKRSSSESLIARAGASTLRPYDCEVDVVHCCCVILSTGFAWPIHSLRGHCSCCDGHFCSTSEAMSPYSLCIQALTLEPDAANAYLQLSRMTGTAEFDLAEELPDNTFVKGRSHITRQELLLIACQCDPRLPDVYTDLSSLVPSYGTIDVLGTEYDKESLLQKASDLMNGVFDDNDAADTATATAAHISQKRDETVTREQQMKLVFSQGGSFKNKVNSSKKANDIATNNGGRTIAVHTGVKSRWTHGLPVFVHSFDSATLAPSFKVISLRKKVRESFEVLYATSNERSAAKKVNELFGDVIAVASTDKEPLPIYAAIGLMEIDPVPFDRISGDTVLMCEVTRCLDTKSSTITYLSDATDCLVNQLKAYKTSAFAGFDPLYLLACSLLERKSGEFKKARALLDAFMTRARGDSVLQELNNVVEREEQLHAIYTERHNKGGSSAKAAGGARMAKDTFPVHRSASARASAAARHEQQQSHKPLVFKCVSDEWQYEKQKLGEEEQEKLGCMDKIMEFVGLEQVKREMLTLYQRIADSKINGFEFTDSLNFQLVGNPGTGKSEMGRLMGKVLMAMGIRPEKSLTATKQRDDAMTQEAQLRAEAGLRAVDEQLQEIEYLKATNELTTSDDLVANCKTALTAVEKSIRDVTGLTALQNQFNAGAGVVLNATVSDMRQTKTQLEIRLAAAETRAAAAKTSVDAAQLTYQQAESKRSAAQQAATDAGSKISPPQIERYIETSGGVLVREGSKELDAIVGPLLAAHPPGGIIFIDEAGQLFDTRGAGGKGMEIVHRLIKLAEDHRGELTIMLSGYKKQIDRLMEADPGLPSRFSNVFEFADYDAAQLGDIFLMYLSRNRPPLRLESDSMAIVVGRRIAKNAGQEGFANARSVRNLLQKIMSRNSKRRKALEYITRAPSDCCNPITDADVLGERPDPSTSATFQELDRMIGQTEVKKSVSELLLRLQTIWDAEKMHRVPPQSPFLNRVFVGNPGTGKTTVGKLYAKLLGETGFLSKGEVILTNPSDFLGLNSGDTMAKTRAILEKSKGNVLLIDEAYGLRGDTDIHKAAVDTIVALSPTQGGADMSIILCGYKGEIDDLRDNMNPGLKGRFPDRCSTEFASFDAEELGQILAFKAAEKELRMPYLVRQAAQKLLAKESKLPTFRNGGAVDLLLEKIRSCAEQRVNEVRLAGGNTVDQLHSSIDSSILTMADFWAATKKAEVDDGVPLLPQIVDKINRLRADTDHALRCNRPPPDLTHMLFVGPAGTGKTTAARKMASLLFESGLLPTDKCVSVVSESLVAGFVGQTQEKVKGLVKEAMGGVLFVDEAHRLNPTSGASEFKKEAIGVLMDAMTSSEYRNKILIIFAGYEGPMDALLACDEGLARRFRTRIVFNDLTVDGAIVCFNKQLERSCYELDSDAPARDMFVDLIERRKQWSNLADVDFIVKELESTVAQAFFSRKSTATTEEEERAVDQEHWEWIGSDKKRFTSDDLRTVWAAMSATRPLKNIPPASDAHPLDAPQFLFSSAPSFELAAATRQSQHMNSESDEEGLNMEETDEATNDDDSWQQEDEFGDDVSSKDDISDDIKMLRAVYWHATNGDQDDSRLSFDDMARLAVGNTKVAEILGVDVNGVTAGLAALKKILDAKWKAVRDEREAQSAADMTAADQESNAQSLLLAKLVNAEICREEEQERERQAEIARLRKEAEAAAQRAAEVRAFAEREAEIQQRLKTIGRCSAGFEWIKVSGGYRCAGGSHFVGDNQL